MSVPPFLDLPAAARAVRLSTARGSFAAHVIDPPDAPGDEGTVLLVPGFTGSKEDFIGLLEPLARAGFRVVAVDGRGQFESGGPRAEAAYAQPELARDVLALARTVGGGGRVHLLGHSLGGLIARAAVLADAAPFASLTLLSSGPAEVAPSQRQRLELLLAALSAMPMDDIWQEIRKLDPAPGSEGDAPFPVAEADASRATAAFLERRWMANVPEQLAVTGRQLASEPDRVAELAGVPLPVHVVSGATDDAWPVPLLDAMAERLGARRSVVAGAGHSPNADRPAETARALAAFWHGRDAG
ncbi:alpha/beta fold hydrolase [Streptomyces sp. HNM0574]|uniref:alpha/beta fold hydrolase n=1 Tax=Streptomyces sp. HNM0574 TaxID=2714954 RepID=UPI00146F2A5E|nr:alpha/beta fold hydrolase [Streptomyces sp. HNM0574]NLU67287.1 alpha/beta hydrolase [Streptomyces sp. HNM0574]